MPSFQVDFDLDINLALRDQLDKAFQQLTAAPLTAEGIGGVTAEGKGVYLLFHQGVLVYAGKAKDLKDRLQDHRFKLEGRTNITAVDMSFSCLFLRPNWVTFAVEDALIAMYKARGLCQWNGTGFGPNDPGVNRDETELKENHFDRMYPIRHDWPMAGIPAGSHECRTLLQIIKDQLPFNFRFQKTGKNKGKAGTHPDYAGVIIEVSRSGMPADELLAVVTRHLPKGWQATRFPHQLLLYKYDVAKHFPEGTILHRSE